MPLSSTPYTHEDWYLDTQRMMPATQKMAFGVIGGLGVLPDAFGSPAWWTTVLESIWSAGLMFLCTPPSYLRHRCLLVTQSRMGGRFRTRTMVIHWHRFKGMRTALRSRHGRACQHASWACSWRWCSACRQRGAGWNERGMVETRRWRSMAQHSIGCWYSLATRHAGGDRLSLGAACCELGANDNTATIGMKVDATRTTLPKQAANARADKTALARVREPERLCFFLDL
ncbi:hypothetical protein DFH07DRAFT_785945 [Mycena maculata]|uniref:Uncharacterized protein n=1 Tax=Mycena maculata TaxID=230809 RepID=A0AAD7H6I9_9AGAR|nr:hypothetical protein DFH07DRAFT_785945 [Mycena maculata]